MSLIPMIIDHTLPYLQGTAEPGSLLGLPLGTGSVLEHLLSNLATVRRENDLVTAETLIMPSFPSTSTYEAGLRTNPTDSLQVVTLERQSSVLSSYESSDYVLVIDPMHWPVEGYDSVIITLGNDDYRGATHVIAVGARTDGTRERVDCDTRGLVKRVQRLYDAKDWPEVAGKAVIFSQVPVHVIENLSFTCLSELRAKLVGKGVLTRDVPINTDVVSLSCPRGFLSLNERIVTRAFGQMSCSVFSQSSAGVMVGQGCRIHPSARLVPPIIIHHHVTIDEGVTVIGPTLLGSYSKVGHGATLVQSVLADHTTVPHDAMIRHQIASGQVDNSSSSSDSPAALCLSAPEPPAKCPCMDEIELLPIEDINQQRRVRFAIKRVMDTVLSLLALVLCAPLMLVVAVLIKLDSKGPVYFAHQREGKGGKEFSCWKFRTMVMHAHRNQRALYAQNQVDGPQFKLRGDPRVTRVGRWLRATNLDELPQLINVLKGEMSLVGPRPSPFRENQICIPWRQARLSARPGITGLWQLCRDKRSDGDFHQWIFYDLNYVRHFSIWLDIKLLLATFATLGGVYSVPLSWMVRSETEKADSTQELFAATPQYS